MFVCNLIYIYYIYIYGSKELPNKVSHRATQISGTALEGPPQLVALPTTPVLSVSIVPFIDTTETLHSSVASSKCSQPITTPSVSQPEIEIKLERAPTRQTIVSSNSHKDTSHAV